MNKKWLWYVCAVLLCCGSLAFVSIAKQSNLNANSASLRTLAKEKALLIQNGQEALYQEKLNQLTGSATDVKTATPRVEGSVGNQTGAEMNHVAAPFANDNKATFEQLKSRLEDGIQLSLDEKALYEELSEQFAPRSESDPLDNQGGPSAFGYQWIDNLGGDTATYAWEEPTTPVELATLASQDDAAENVPWAFNFPFYGANYTSGFASTNGVISLAASNNSWTNQCPRSTSGPTGVAILPFWDDGNTSTGASSDGGRIVYQIYADHVTITWDSVGSCCTAGNDRLDYQVQLWTSGKIKFQYRQIQAVVVDASSNGSSPLIGIQQSSTLDFLNYHCATTEDSAYTNALDGRAVWFYMPAVAPTGRCCYIGANPCAYTCQAGVNLATCATLGGAYIFTPNTTCATACPAIVPGDNVACPVVIPSVPYSDAGNTCGFTNDYDEVCPYTGSLSPDKVYSYTPGANQTVDITLCGGTTNYDTKLYLYQNTVTPGAPFACNDDACTAPLFASPYVSQLLALNLTGGSTYYIVVDGYGSLCGDYTLSISIPQTGSCCYGDNVCCLETTSSNCATLGGTFTAGGTCAANPCTPTCLVNCDAFDILEVAENDAPGFETTDPNGGCNTTNPGPSYQDIACGDIVCGRMFFYGAGAFRDTDWYRFTIAGPDPMNVQIGGIAEFSGLQLGLVDGISDCLAPFFVTSAGGFEVACGTNYTATTLCLNPGTYALFVSISAGEFTCPTLAADAGYRAWVTCSPCTPPQGRCCYNDGLSCLDTDENNCLTNLLGVWDAFSTCALNPCPIPPANDDCVDAIALAVVPNGSVSAAVDNSGAANSCSDVCDFTSTGPDQFFTITLTECRLIAITADPNDPHLSVYNNGDCCGTAILCDDDWGNFDLTGLTWVNPAIYPVSGLGSLIADSLAAGTYYIRAGYYGTGSAPYTLTVYDFGPCVAAPCDPITDLSISVLSVGNLPSQYKLWWTAPQTEDYKVWSTTFMINDGNPNDGADPQWVLETTLLGVPMGATSWTAPAGFVAYKNFVVTAVCTPYTPPVGRCCYDNNTACQDVTQAACDGLGGDWGGQFVNCTDDPCPPPLPTGRCCYNGGANCATNFDTECTGLGGTWMQGLNCIDNPCGVAPANDNCGTAVQVFNGVPMAGTNIDATADALGDLSCVFEDFFDVWYVYNAPNTSPVTAALCDPATDFDTGMRVFDGCGGSELGCDDDFCVTPGLASQVTWTPAAPGPYYIRVAGFDSQQGNFVLTVTQ